MASTTTEYNCKTHGKVMALVNTYNSRKGTGLLEEIGWEVKLCPAR